MDQVKKLREKFIRSLPIWDLCNNFRVELDKLDYDISRHSDDIKELDQKIESLPKIDIDRRILTDRKRRDLDIIKLYTYDQQGNCVILADDGFNEKTERLHQDSSINDSLELLGKKLYVDEVVYAMVEPGKPWKKGRIRKVLHTAIKDRPSTVIKLEITADDGKMKVISVNKFAIARAQKHGDKLRTSKRVVAGPNENTMRPGIIGQDPGKINHNRYLVMFDNGNALYCRQDQVFPICYQTAIPWKDFRYVENKPKPALESELTYFFKMYPRRHLLAAKIGTKFDLYRDGLVVPARVIQIDCDVLQIAYEDGVEECIYAGSARITQRATLVSTLTKDQIALEKLYHRMVAHMHYYHSSGVKAFNEDCLKWFGKFDSALSICGRTARKSTGKLQNSPKVKVRTNERIVADDRETCPDLQDYLSESQRNHKKCTIECVTSVKKYDPSAFMDVCDIKVPLLLGWKRVLVQSRQGNSKEKKTVYIYEAPCGRVCTSTLQIKWYLKQTQNSDLDMDFFAFERSVILNRPSEELKCYYYDENVAKDAEGCPLENKYISLINSFNEERLPLDYEYKNESFPHPMLKAKGFSFNKDFKSGCDCADDCSVRSACSCHQLNEHAAGTNAHKRGAIDFKCQYKDKRLTEQVSTGIFECNEFCSCSSKCPNRVVQNGIRARLQVRKTVSKGWGVFALDDIPKGAFICTYAAELLDDADQYGADDMYFADLDYISVVEEGKIILDEDEGIEFIDEELEDNQSEHSNSSDTIRSKNKKDNRSSEDREQDYDDAEFVAFLPRYPKRNRNKASGQATTGARNNNELRIPFRRINDILDEKHDTYTLDARMQGNIGRFFNHSCDPNAFVQNVFIDTHDLRFPVVAFFTKNSVKADDEITWNYNYKIDSIAGRQIICNCSAPNCKGRIL